MTTSKTSPSELIGQLRTEKIKKIERQIKRFWEMFDTRIDKDNAVNGSGKNMLKLACLEQILKFEDQIIELQKPRPTTMAELYKLGWLKVIHLLPCQGDIPPHSFLTRFEEFERRTNGRVYPCHRKKFICIKCGFETNYVSDLRKSYNMFGCTYRKK